MLVAVGWRCGAFKCCVSFSERVMQAPFQESLKQTAELGASRTWHDAYVPAGAHERARKDG